MRKFTSAETVEIKINSTNQTKFYFPELPNLRDKLIERIDTYYVSSISESPEDRALCNNTVMFKAFLVLVSKGNEVINRIPLNNILITATLFNSFPLNLVIDYTKSYIEIANTASLSASESFIFTFYFNEREFIQPIRPGSLMKIENIEILTSPTSIRRFHFPDNENLRNKIIKVIIYPDSISTVLTPGGDSLVNITVFKKSYLVLVSRNKEIINKIPLYTLQKNRYDENRVAFNNIEIDFVKSYIEVSDTADLVATEKFFLNIFYFDKDSAGNLPGTRERPRIPDRRRRWPS